MLLSACLIVKNEALTIRKCLDSLQGVADEVIVVDTGCTDETVDIAKSYGARVFTYEWDNNFANARNESLKYANGDFVLVIDADEYLDSEQRKGLRDFLSNTEAEGILTSIQNYIGSISRMDKSTPVAAMRIFRRGHWFTGAIHEQILNSVMATGKPIEKFDLTFHHLGYLHEFVVGRNKSERNMKLLEAELSKNPDDFFQSSNIVAEYMRSGDYAKCAELAKQCFEQYKQNPVASTHLVARVITYLIHALLQNGQAGEAEKYAREGIKLFPMLPDIRRGYALVLLAQDRAQEALGVLMKCREIGDIPEALTDTLEGSGSFLAAADLAGAWAKLGDDGMARKWYLQSFYECPRIETILSPLLYLLPLSPDVLHRQLEERITDWVALGTYAESYACLGYGDADQVIERVERKHGQTEYTSRARMALALHQGREVLLEEAKGQSSETSSLLLGLYLLNEGSLDGAMEAFQQAGARGKHVLDILEKTEKGLEIQLGPIIRDLVTMRASDLLERWMPMASDRNNIWVYVKYSPLHPVLSSIEWLGNSGWECEQNIQRLFKEGDISGCIDWLERAMAFPPTVSKVLLEADIALAHQNVRHAQKVLKAGQHLFPDSELLQAVVRNIGTIDTLRDHVDSEFPLNIAASPTSMVQLHQMGIKLTNQIRLLNKANDVNGLRETIAQLQELIQSCRGLLDLKDQNGQLTDKTYQFYYDLSFRWYLQPSSIEQDIQAMIDFWTSWADTWQKISQSLTFSQS